MKKAIVKRLSSPFDDSYEFWPFWIFYGLLTPLFLFYSFKLKSLSYCTLANPKIRNGGLINYSKIEILNFIEKERIPKTAIWKDEKDTLLDFPFVAKPDSGERGIGIELIHNQRDWIDYLQNHSAPVQLQEYIDWPFEFGIFYYRFPNEEKGEILGITGKKFLTMIGNGKLSIEGFINLNLRAKKRKKYLLDKFKTRLKEIPNNGEQIILEEIGNHNRGTQFYDASRLMSEPLLNAIDTIAKQIPEFYYGRFDVKAKSEEDFQNGQFVILEVNGTNSEATHIYDEHYSLYDAYSEVCRKLDIQYQIAKANKERGFKAVNSRKLAKEIFNYICFPRN